MKAPALSDADLTRHGKGSIAVGMCFRYSSEVFSERKKCGAGGRTRTCDRSFSRGVLCLTELRRHWAGRNKKRPRTKVGVTGGLRTHDHRITNPALCLLSYRHRNRAVPAEIGAPRD
jgi:hypothetical protein